MDASATQTGLVGPSDPSPKGLGHPATIPCAWEADCLACDPFDGDFGGAGADDGVLSDKMVTARKGGECHTCAGPIEPGTRVRRRAEVYDGEFMRFSWCEPCCRAMAADDGELESEHERRIAIGQERRGASAIEAHRGETAGLDGDSHESAAGNAGTPE